MCIVPNLKNNKSLQISSHVIKIASKNSRFSGTERFIQLWKAEACPSNILLDNYKIRQGKEESVEIISEKLEMKSK